MHNEDEIIKKVADLGEKVALLAMEWLLMVAIPVMVVKSVWLILHGQDMWFAGLTIVFASGLMKPLRIVRAHNSAKE